MNAENIKTMEKSKEASLDDLAVGVLGCVRRLLELLERCVRADAMHTKDTATNTTGNETDSTGKSDQQEKDKEDNAADKSGVEGELRDVLQIMVGTLRRIVDDLKKEDKAKSSPLPSIFDISLTSSEKTIAASENTPDETNEENGNNNNSTANDRRLTIEANECETTDQDEGIVEDKEELDTPEGNTDGMAFQVKETNDHEGNAEIWNENAEEDVLDENNPGEHCAVDEETEEEPPIDENTVGEDGEAEEGGDSIGLDVEDVSGDLTDVEPPSEEGSGDHHPLIEEIDLINFDEEGAVAYPAGVGAGAAIIMEEENWESEGLDRTQSVSALAFDDTNVTEDEDTADDSAQREDPSDMEYDSFFPTEDEDVVSKADAASDEEAPEILGLSAVRMFRKHMEMDNVEVEMFPTPRAQPRRHFFYTCRVLGLEAEACGRSKRAAKRNAISKIIRLIIKKQKDGSLPAHVTPFTTEELSSLAEACRGGADYLSRLRQLCRALKAPPPTYDVQVSLEPDSADRVFTVQCSALGRTAVGICAKKRSAKRHAAREIVKRYEEEAAAVGAPVTVAAKV